MRALVAPGPAFSGAAFLKVRPPPKGEARAAASRLDGKRILRDRLPGVLIDAFRPYRDGVVPASGAEGRRPSPR